MYNWCVDTTSRHQCMVYKGAPSQQIPVLAASLSQMLGQNYRCLYLNSQPMISGMRSALAALDIDVMDKLTTGHLVMTSESSLTPDGNFDTDLMLERLEDDLDRALDRGYVGLFATGCMTWEFSNRANLAGLLEYEWRLEELLRHRQELCGICQYHYDTLPAEILRQGLVSHAAIFINDTLSRINPHHSHSELHADQSSKNCELDNVIRKLCLSQEIGY
jgi:hypothetical protein